MAPEKNHPPSYDLLIIGGGPAGMSAALTAGRARLETVVVNAESPRNAVTTASHGFLTRDGVHPSQLLELGKEQLVKYDTVRYLKDTVISVAGAEGGFEVVLAAGGQLKAEQMIIATGYVDELDRLSLPGIEDVYGKSLYPCIFCDGFEHKGERLALFGSEGAAGYAPMVRMWTDDLIVFTNGGELSPKETETLRRNCVQIRTEPVRHLESGDGVLQWVELETGERVRRDAGFIADDYSRPATTFAESLGVTKSANEWGMIALDAEPSGQTTVKGLHVVGDARTGFSGLVAAAAEGAACAEMIVHEIAADRWRNR